MLSSQEQHILIYIHLNLNVCSVILPKNPNPSYGLIGLKKIICSCLMQVKVSIGMLFGH